MTNAARLKWASCGVRVSEPNMRAASSQLGWKRSQRKKTFGSQKRALIIITTRLTKPPINRYRTCCYARCRLTVTAANFRFRLWPPCRKSSSFPCFDSPCGSVYPAIVESGEAISISAEDQGTTTKVPRATLTLLRVN